MFPTPVSFLKKVLRILKSSLTPNQIAFSFALGILAGLPPTGLHVIVPATLALMLRCSFRAFLLSMGLFKLLSLAVAPAAYAVGRYLLDSHRGLDGLWRRLFHLPILAPMGYSRYLLLGSLVLAVVLAIPAFLAVRILVIRYRTRFASRVRGWRISRALHDKRGVRFVRRLFAGGEAKYEREKPPWGPFRFVRRGMLVGLPAIYAACYLLAALIVPVFAGGIATTAASWAIGGEVAVRESRFSLFTGRLTLDHLTVQDPQKSDENVLEVPSLTLDVGMLPLTAKRVIFDSVKIGEVRLHVERQEDGTLNVDDFGEGWNIDGYLAWAAEHAQDVDWLGLLGRLLDYLAQPAPRKPLKPDFSRYAGGRVFPAFRPPFVVKRLEIGRIHLTLEDRLSLGAAFPPITMIDLQLTNLSAPHDLSDEPVGLRVTGRVGEDDAAIVLAATWEGRSGARRTRFEFEMQRIDLRWFEPFYEMTLPLTLVSGVATLKAAWSVQHGEIDGTVSLVVEDLAVAVREGQALFGLTPVLTERVIEGINRYGEALPLVIGFPVGGSADAPELGWERPILEAARQGLLMAGRRELNVAIAQLGLRVDALVPSEEVDLPEAYEALRERTAERAWSLIRGVPTDAPADESVGDESADPLVQLFDLLLRRQEDAAADAP